jgi:hypothetical protein
MKELGAFELAADYITRDVFHSLRTGKSFSKKIRISKKYIFRCVEDLNYTHCGQDICNGHTFNFKKGTEYSFLTKQGPDPYILPNPSRYFRFIRVEKKVIKKIKKLRF